tara:strand:- start:99 stop:1607 length:1509 start_codon:yes stop_codon:yes gene_type:complete
MFNRITSILLSLIFFVLSNAVAQELDDGMTLEKKSIVILPGKDAENPESISSKVTSIVAAKAVELGRFNVIDRTQIESILAEQKLQLSGMINENQIVEIGNLAAADQALIVKIITFGQRGVPPPKKETKKEEGEKKEKKEKKEYDESLFEWIIKESVTAGLQKTLEGVELYPNNIQTIIRTEVGLLNIESGVLENNFHISASHTGGNKTASLNNALNQIGWQISRKLREFYLIASEVIEKEGNKITILTGSDMGLEEGTIFEVNSLDQEKMYKGRVITLPGNPIALAKLTNVGKNTSDAEIIRQWKEVKAGHSVNEMIFDPTAITYGIKTRNGSNFSLNAKFCWSPFKKITTLFTGEIGTIKDTRGENDFLFGLGMQFKTKLRNIGKYQFSTGISLPYNYFAKIDDDTNYVSQSFINPSINLTTSIILDRKRDLFISLQYVWLNFDDIWQYSELIENENDNYPDSTTYVKKYYDAVWDENKKIPRLNTKGLYITMGMRFFDY